MSIITSIVSIIVEADRNSASVSLSAEARNLAFEFLSVSAETNIDLRPSAEGL